MSKVTREILQQKTKDELIQMYLDLVATNSLETELALTDPLTTVYNRRGMEKAFTKLLTENKLDNMKLAFIDIDCFKQLNDSKGHDFGDYVLETFAHKLKDYFKDSYISRFGGDEFLVLTDLSTNEIVAFEQLISDTEFSDHYTSATVTCTVGVVQYHDNESLKHWINEADTIMYKYKKKKK